MSQTGAARAAVGASVTSVQEVFAVLSRLQARKKRLRILERLGTQELEVIVRISRESDLRDLNREARAVCLSKMLGGPVECEEEEERKPPVKDRLALGLCPRCARPIEHYTSRCDRCVVEQRLRKRPVNFEGRTGQFFRDRVPDDMVTK